MPPTASIFNMTSANTAIFRMFQIPGRIHTGTGQLFRYLQEIRDERFQLIFKGINYRAAVWVNGHQVADSSKMAGMFAEYFLDVTDLCEGW